VLHSLDIEDLGATVYSLSRTAKRLHPRDRSKLKELREAGLVLAEEVSKRADSASLDVLSSVIYGIGVLFKSRPNEFSENERLGACVGRLTEEVCKECNIKSFSNQALSALVYGYSSVGWTPEGVLQRLSDEIKVRLGKDFCSLSICSLIYSLSRMRWFDESLVVALAMESVRLERIKQLSSQEICNVLYGLTRLTPSMQEPEKLLLVFKILLVQAIDPSRLAKYSKKDLTWLIRCSVELLEFNKLKDEVRELMESSLLRFTQKVKTVPKLDQNVCYALYSCAKFSLQNDEFLNLVDKLIYHQSQRLDSPWTTTLILWSLTSLDRLSHSSLQILCHRLCQLRKEGAIMTKQDWVQLSQSIRYTLKGMDKIELDPRVEDLLEEAERVFIEI